MADQWNGGQSGPGERWNVNLPAVIGVVFVFLVGVIVWVIASSGGDDEITTDTLLPGSTTSVPPGITAQTTTPLPMPSTTLVPPTAPSTAPVTVPATAAPTAAPTAPPAPPPQTAPPATAAPQPPPAPPPTQAPVPPQPTTTTTPAPPPPVPQNGGDLGVPGHAITHPPCNGGYITVLASAIGSQATANSMD